MGNSAIIVVFASIISGMMIFLNIQRINTEANVVQTYLQDEVLARELAHNGLNLALARYNAGHANIAGSIAYQDGTIEIKREEPSPGQVIFKVLGEYGDAQYLMSSTYDFAANFICGICIDGFPVDIPMHEDTEIWGGDDVSNDFTPFMLSTSEYQRLENQPGLSGLVDISEVEDNLNASLREAHDGLTGEVTEVDVLDDTTLDDLLPDINPAESNPWLQEFYFTSLDKMQVGEPNSNDAYFGPALKGTPHIEEFGSNDPSDPLFGQNYVMNENGISAIVRVDGDMVVRNGSTFSGAGILIIEGNLTVDPGATLNWDGILFLRPETSHSVSNLDGTVNLNGALLAYQEALPPGSHMDVTTNRDLSGTWVYPEGTQTNQASIPIQGPWFVHIHKWDQSWYSRPAISTLGEVLMRFNGGQDIHENYVRFNESMNAIAASGYEKVYFKFVNPAQSGMGVFNITLNQNGTPVNYRNSVSAGFPGVKSQAFRPSELTDFGIQIRSVRFLQLVKDPDPNGSSLDGAHRVARDHARQQSFYVEVRDEASDKLLMTTAIYQHIREDENEEYEQELEELRQDILDGNFGLSIDMGPGTTIRYDDVKATSALSLTELPSISHVETFTRRCNSSDVNCDLRQVF